MPQAHAGRRARSQEGSRRPAQGHAAGARAMPTTLRFDVKYVFCHQRPSVRRVRPLHRTDQTARSHFRDFPAHPDLTARYARDTGIDLTKPEAAMLFQADSPAWSQSRYYQDAAIRAAFEKILLDRQAGKPPRVLLSLATGAGKTIIATNLLWRLSRGRAACPNPRCFCATATNCASRPTPSSRPPSATTPASSKPSAATTPRSNARIHIATYQTLGPG